MEPNKFLLKQYLNKLKNKCNSGDEEVDHVNADKTLCELLDDLGYNEITAEFNKIDKWYA